tara:strand:+ start:1506 stop:2504 length:999 start_codon:yes stop_codon:yes gene_type:complete
MKKIIEKNERIFIAGSNGMVGSSIKRALLKNPFNQVNKFLNLLTPSRLELDLLDSISVKNWFAKEKPNIVILAAAKVGGIHANSKYPTEFLLENIKIQTNIIEAALKEGVRRLLFLGSSCIYPKYAIQPIKEEELMNGSLEKTNESYAIAKITGIKLCEALRNQYNFDSISLMPTNLYGPNDNYHPLNSHVVPSLIRKFSIAKRDNLSSVTCWGSGLVCRELMHVDDLAEAAIFCLENWFPSDIGAPKDNSGNPLNYLNVGTGKDISIKELAKKIAEIVKFDGEIFWDKNMPDGTPRKVLDISRLKKLGWESKIDLNSGLANTINALDVNDF